MINEIDVINACGEVERKIIDELSAYGDWNDLLNIGALILGYDHPAVCDLYDKISCWNGDE